MKIYTLQGYDNWFDSYTILKIYDSKERAEKVVNYLINRKKLTWHNEFIVTEWELNRKEMQSWEYIKERSWDDSEDKKDSKS